MGKLSHLTSGVDKIRKRLESAEAMGGDVSDLFDEGFGRVNSNLNKAMKDLVAESNRQQNTAFSSVVSQAVLAVTQSQQMFLNAVSRITDEVISSRDSLTKEVGKVSSGVGSVNQSLAGQINNLAKSVERLPTQFPEQKETDLSGLAKDIKAVGSAIRSIPAPLIPKTDLTGLEKTIAGLEKKLSKRVHIFEIQRDANDLAKTITVRTK
jgi:hypothetical protein